MGRWIFLFIAAFGLSSYPQFISLEIQNISYQSYKIITWCRLTILNRKKTKQKKIPKLYQDLFYEINRRLRLQVSKCKILSPKLNSFIISNLLELSKLRQLFVLKPCKKSIRELFHVLMCYNLAGFDCLKALYL